MNSKIVVGLGHGDEGKGVTVDNLCTPNSLVVRFSGGQQAGHTVIRNGIKHIFSNFGAGTLQGCPTFFTEDTCIYPKTISREWGDLKSKGVSPQLVVSPMARVTTPWDVWAGRNRERQNKHGSCGLGIGATMKRNEGPVKLYAIDLTAPKRFLEQRLKAIADYYEYESDMCRPFNDDVDAFMEAVENPKFFVGDKRDIKYDNLVFEGSQGILLDMDQGVFPHVTYANTTSKNAWKHTEGPVEIFYGTRCYQTRHGNGPFEEQNIDLINNEEEINKENEWQGPFKKAEVDYSLLKYAISVDRAYHPRKVPSNLVVTCLDQRPGFEFDWRQFPVHGYWENNSPHSGNLKEKLI